MFTSSITPVFSNLKTPPYSECKTLAPNSCTCRSEQDIEASWYGTEVNITWDFSADLDSWQLYQERTNAQNVGRGKRTRLLDLWRLRCRRGRGPCGLCLLLCRRFAEIERALCIESNIVVEYCLFQAWPVSWWICWNSCWLVLQARLRRYCCRDIHTFWS